MTYWIIGKFHKIIIFKKGKRFKKKKDSVNIAFSNFFFCEISKLM
jgi:hypothetical protein